MATRVFKHEDGTWSIIREPSDGVGKPVMVAAFADKAAAKKALREAVEKEREQGKLPSR